MKMDPNLFSNEPAPEDNPDLFSNEPAPEDQASFGGFVHNAGDDLGHMIKGGIEFGKQNILHPIDAKLNFAKNLPGALIGEGKRVGVGELLTGHPMEAAKKFGHAFYEKPVTTALDVLPFAEGAGKLIGGFGKAGKAAEMAGAAGEAGGAAETVAPAAEGVGLGDDLSRVAEGAPKPVEIPSEANDILGQAGKSYPRVEPEPIPTGRTFQETVQNLTNKIPTEVKQPLDELKSYLEEKYGKAAKTPGVAENFGKALEQKGRGMRLKEIGSSPGQARQLRDRFGEDAVNRLADLADEKGITKGFFNFQTGKAIENLMGDSGKKVGAIRDMASNRGAVHNTEHLIQQIRQELDPIYLKGSGSAQKGAYMKALEDIKNAPSDASSLADLISEKNRFLKKNRLTQPIGAGTDVLNRASRINNELINKFLKPEEKQIYEEALRDFSASKIFDKMYGFTYGRDMAGRSGPSNILNTIKDIGGRKIMEKVFTNVGKGLQNKPGMLGNAGELSAEVLDSIDSALDEIIEQMKGNSDAPTQ